MDRYRVPAVPSPALEFCAVISGKEHTPGGAGAFAILDDDERLTLDRLLSRYNADGATSELERQARTFLLAYRERERSGTTSTRSWTARTAPSGNVSAPGVPGRRSVGPSHAQPRLRSL